MRLLPRLLFVRAALLGAWAACAFGCMQATQTYALVLHPQTSAQSGRSPSGNPDEAAGPRATTQHGERSEDTTGTGMVGTLSVERIEGGQHLVVLQLEQLPPPERIAPGLRSFVVWLEDPRGGEVNVGTLRYDRANHSGNLLATTDLSAFTVRVTGERDAGAAEPAGVLLAERRVECCSRRPRARFDTN